MGDIIGHLHDYTSIDNTSLLAASFFSKGQLDKFLVIANTKGQYGGDR